MKKFYNNDNWITYNSPSTGKTNSFNYWILPFFANPARYKDGKRFEHKIITYFNFLSSWHKRNN